MFADTVQLGSSLEVHLYMSRKYKFYNPSGIYFVSFATVYWLDVFVREEYYECLTKKLAISQKEQGMKLYAYCFMPGHVHLIFSSEECEPSTLLKSFKSVVSREMKRIIAENIQESRKEWMMWMFERAGKKNCNNSAFQFWQQHNKPIELWSNKVIQQKLDYVHYNPVLSGFVEEPQHWNRACELTEGNYSSAKNYSGLVGQLSVDLLL